MFQPAFPEQPSAAVADVARRRAHPEPLFEARESSQRWAGHSRGYPNSQRLTARSLAAARCVHALCFRI